MDVTVAVGTFGDPAWWDLARARAIPSARRLGVPVVHMHRDSLHEARNAALKRVETANVIHLDADDELERGYINFMDTGWADIRAPSVRYVRNARHRPPARMPRVAGHRHACTADCLPDGNWLVIGTCAPTQLIRDVGGWRDWPVYEDWDLWLRCWQAGATIEPLPKAVYRAHVTPTSRNRAPNTADKNHAHRAIVAANFPEVA